MNVSPVSFGSLMVFTVENGKSVHELMKKSFSNNLALKDYKLKEETIMYYEDDGSVHNVVLDIIRKLDRKYRGHDKQLPNGSKEVLFTEAHIAKKKNEPKIKYFLTAATKRDEKRIFKALNESEQYIVTKYIY